MPVAKLGKMYYLSGAPRVSTAELSTTPGPRSHILGITGSAAKMGIGVSSRIAGDTAIARKHLQGEGSDSVGSGWRGVVRDSIRVVWRWGFALWAYRCVPTTPFFVYERYGLMQSGAMLLRRRATCVIVECNGIFFKEADGDRSNLTFKRLARYWEIRSYVKSDLVIAVSEQLRGELISLHPRLERTAICVPNGVDTDHFSPRSLVRADSESWVIGWIGTILRWQGVFELIESVARVSRDSGLRICIKIIGDGPDRDRCVEVAERLLPGRVEFVGRVATENVPSLFDNVDFAYAGHLPLTDAPMYHSPLKLFEYMSMGIPTVASDSRDARSTLSVLGLDSMIFDSSSPESLDKALLAGVSFGRDSKIRSRMRRAIVDHHSWTNRLELILAKATSLIDGENVDKGNTDD
ncbi:glycosyltransferase [Rhodococcus sp. ARC_M12]|uniref:glycosyltransferase n=1 Tax=Rhodococcus sp. ARC_M12 TaxID=2928854 RepID=UPI0035AE5A40